MNKYFTISKRCNKTFISGKIDDVRVYAAKFYNESTRVIAHGIKNGDIDSIKKAAKAMAHMLPDHCILVPIPSRNGIATTSEQLAVRLVLESKHKIVTVSDVLIGKERRSNYICKLEGNPLTEEDLEFKMLWKDFDEEENIIFIDNVIDTGVTAMAAAHAYGKPCSVMAYAITTKALE